MHLSYAAQMLGDRPSPESLMSIVIAALPPSARSNLPPRPVAARRPASLPGRTGIATHSAKMNHATDRFVAERT